MNSEPDLSLREIQRKRQEAGGAAPGVPGHAVAPVHADAAAGALPVSGAASAGGKSLPVDPLRLVDAVWRAAPWALVLGLLAGGAAFAFGKLKFKTTYTASVQIIKQETGTTFRTTDVGENFKPQALTPQTLTTLMRGGNVIQPAASRVSPPLPEGELTDNLTILPERNTEIIRATFVTSASPARAVEVVNAYGDEVVRMTRDFQSAQAGEVSTFLRQQLEKVETDWAKASDALQAYAHEARLLDADKQMDAYLSELANYNLKYEEMRLEFDTIDMRIQAATKELSQAGGSASQIDTAKKDLAEMLTRYTEENPIVQEQRTRIAEMEKQAAESASQPVGPPRAGESTVVESLYLRLVELRTQKESLAEQLRKLDEVRGEINAKLEQLPGKQAGYAKLKAQVQQLDSTRSILSNRQREAQVYAAGALGNYRIVTPSRVEEVRIDSPTRKTIIVTVGAFGAVVALILFLAASRSALDLRVRTRGDLKRLTRAALLDDLPRGDGEIGVEKALRSWAQIQPVLHANPNRPALCAVVEESTGEGAARLAEALAGACLVRGIPAVVMGAGLVAEGAPDLGQLVSDPSGTTTWLREHKGAKAPVLPAGAGWEWNHENRRAWQSAIARWPGETVIFLVLPAASDAMSLAWAEAASAVVWVAASDRHQQGDLASRIGLFREAGCRLAAAALSGPPRLKPAFLQSVVSAIMIGFFLLLGSASPARAQPAASGPAPDNIAATPGTGSRTVSWTERLTLGPSDIVGIKVFGKPDWDRERVQVGNDGTLTYLQVQNLPVTQLTLDELRAELEKQLAKQLRNPRVIVTPVQFQSRKVYVLGKVLKKGAVNLDRPMTIIETVSEAGGLETGLFQQNTVELADLGRSFIVRGRQRLPIDMEKLFLKGDMTQNILVEPNDYLYFPSANSNEIYVLGAVANQGTQGLLAQTSVVSAVATAGGFAPNAFRDRVLVVRGSLEKPEPHVINVNAIMAGREKNFLLQPQDIVYVATKPWDRAEQLLAAALDAFLQGAVANWAGVNIGPFFKEPILPQLNDPEPEPTPTPAPTTTPSTTTDPTTTTTNPTTTTTTP